MHYMFDLIINIIGTPFLGMSIVFTKIGYIHQMLQLSHINLRFDLKNSLQYIYLIINVIFTLLESISMNFKVFLLIFDISIFIKNYSPIYLRYIQYIHKMQVPIYPSKPIFPTLLIRRYFLYDYALLDLAFFPVYSKPAHRHVKHFHP